MDSIIGFFAQLPAFLLDHPALIVASVAAGAIAGVVTWHKSKDN
jgi:hypothetical protein